MAAPRILSLSKTIFTTTNKQTLTSFFLTRSFSSATSKSATSLSLSNFSLLKRLRPLSSVVSLSSALSTPNFRTFSTQQTQNALSDGNPNWSNRPPKETILLDGCDFEHWLVVTEAPPENATRDDIIDSYIKTLAEIVGSEEEARMKIYSVSTKHYYAFGALVSEEVSYKIKELPNVKWVLPDSYLDVRNKDYGGEPFIDGRAVPYDPKYHEDWVRNNAKAQERNRRNDRPRTADRSRNFDRRQQPRNTGGPPQGNMGGPPQGNMGGPPQGNMGGPPQGNMGGPQGNMGGPPNNYPGGAPHNRPPPNAGYGQPPSNAGYGQMPPNNAGYGQNMPPNNAGYGQNMPPNNAGYGQNMPPQGNQGFAQNAPPNRGNMPPNHGGPGGYGQNIPQQNYHPQNNMGGQPAGGYQPQDVPGRDMPNY